MFAHAGDSDDEDEDRENLVRSRYDNSTQRNIFRTLIQVGEVEEEREGRACEAKCFKSNLIMY